MCDCGFLLEIEIITYDEAAHSVNTYLILLKLKEFEL